MTRNISKKKELDNKIAMPQNACNIYLFDSKIKGCPYFGRWGSSPSKENSFYFAFLTMSLVLGSMVIGHGQFTRRDA